MTHDYYRGKMLEPESISQSNTPQEKALTHALMHQAMGDSYRSENGQDDLGIK
jgi:hypothetical protein